MTQLSYTLPTVGNPNSTEDPLIRTALSDIKTAVNGNLDTDNFAANTIVQADVNTSFITSGTYSPTLRNDTNVTSSTAYSTAYFRIGSVVHVAGLVLVDFTTGSTLSALGISLPIGSDFSSVVHAAGAGNISLSAPTATGPLAIHADTTNNELSMYGVCSSDVSEKYYSFVATYRVL